MSIFWVQNTLNPGAKYTEFWVQDTPNLQRKRSHYVEFIYGIDIL